MPGYDPVRDAGGSDRSSPPPNRYAASGSRPSPSTSAYVQHSAIYADGSSAPRRSLSGHSLDRYGESHAVYSRHSEHDAADVQASISPRSSFAAQPQQQRRSSHYADDGHPSNRTVHSPRNNLFAEAPPQPPRRSASIADLIAASEMTEAEHDRHREAHRWSAQYAGESLQGHSLSRSSSASGGFQGTPTSLPHSSSHPRISPQLPRQIGRAERSPSMVHLLNEGTPGAIEDRPRSSSHSSVSSYVSHQQPHFHTNQMSPLGYPSHHSAQNPATHHRDRTLGSHPAVGPSGSFRVSSPTSAYPPGIHPPSLSTLNRGGSSPGLGSAHIGHPVERARYASQTGSVGHAPLPRSGSNSYAYTSASSSPASNAHAHLQPSPSHRFAVPELPFARSPESRRVPLPLSPSSAHAPHPRASVSHHTAQAWGAEEYESSAADMPPPPMNASPRRGSMTNSSNFAHRQPPTTPGNGIPPTPGSMTSHGGYPITPGARSLPPHTPNSANLGRGREGYEESNYFPRMDANASDSYDRFRERTSSLTSPHLRQLEHASHADTVYEPSVDAHHGYRDASAPVRTPGSGYAPDGASRSSVHPPPSLPPTAMSPSFGPQRRSQIATEDEAMMAANDRMHGAHNGMHGSADRAYDLNDRRSPAHSVGHSKERRHSQVSAMSYDTRGVDGHDARVESSSTRQAHVTSSLVHSLPTRDHDEVTPHRFGQKSDHSERKPDHESDSETQEQVHAEADINQSAVKAEANDDPHTRPLPRYAPTRRVSPPKQVMRPIGIEEVDRKRSRCRNPLRREWEELHHADSREVLDEILREFHTKLSAQTSQAATSNGGEKSSTGAKKRAIGDTLEDAEEVADHYNKRREVGIQGREESPIIALRRFNNWVKSVLVGQFARGRDPTLDGRTRARGGRILDLGCGKGGDLKKWEKVHPSGLVGADIAAVSIEQAIARHRETKNNFPGDFFAFDCFSMSLTEVIPRELLEPMFDNVTLQFCMHYAWESVQKARMMLDNVSRYLRRGGVFIGTIPDSRELQERMAASPHPEDRSFGNRYYKVVFDQIETFPAFGNRYTFFLEDAVENVPEYVVDFDVFEDLAHEVGLRCIYRKNFAEIYHEGSRDREHGKLLEKMRVVDRYGSLNLDEEMWQAATLYLGFAFEKM